MDIPLTNPRMIHDFHITENYVIIPDLPMEFNVQRALAGGFLFQFDKEQPARYGIMKRIGQTVDQIQWFELPNHYVFHYANGWEY